MEYQEQEIQEYLDQLEQEAHEFFLENEDVLY